MGYYFDAMDKQYGSKYIEDGGAEDITGLEVTGCSIFIWNVLMYGYKKIGEDAIANKLNSMTRGALGPLDVKTNKRTGLAQFLIDHDWQAHYWNPDGYTPRDSDPEHSVSFQQALDYEGYYQTDLNGVIVGYNKTTKNYKGKVTEKYIDEDPENMKVFAELKKEKFCVGICRGGMHTFLLSEGKVWEVHWTQYRDKAGKQKLPLIVKKGWKPGDKYSRYLDVKKDVLGFWIFESGNKDAWQWVSVTKKDNAHLLPAKLYENTTDFIDFSWLSGLILTPPESTFKSRHIVTIQGKAKIVRKKKVLP
jgi:hypothetical protein